MAGTGAFPFQHPGEQNVLACIQSDILNLSDRGTGESQKQAVSEKDDSVQVHSCHSPRAGAGGAL